MLGSCGGELGNELSAWDALSDEALSAFEEHAEVMTEPTVCETTAGMVQRGKETLHIKAPDLTFEGRVTQLEDALLAVVRRLAALERQMEAVNGQGDEVRPRA